MSFAETIQALAAETGIEIAMQNDDVGRIDFKDDGGDTQSVFVINGGAVGGMPMVQFSTPVTALPPGQLPAELSDTLLVQNSRLLIGSFSVHENQERRLLLLTQNLMLEGLRGDQFRMAAEIIARTGGEFEQMFDKDEDDDPAPGDDA